jgi:predicted ATPase
MHANSRTVRYLCLVATLLSPRPPLLMALNEPETSLHPDLLVPLGELLAAMSERCHLWVTAHSEPLAAELHRLKRIAPIRLAKKQGATTLADSDSDLDQRPAQPVGPWSSRSYST